MLEIFIQVYFIGCFSGKTAKKISKNDRNWGYDEGHAFSMSLYFYAYKRFCYD